MKKLSFLGSLYPQVTVYSEHIDSDKLIIESADLTGQRFLFIGLLGGHGAFFGWIGEGRLFNSDEGMFCMRLLLPERILASWQALMVMSELEF
jgi:hypothetical protein